MLQVVVVFQFGYLELLCDNTLGSLERLQSLAGKAQWWKCGNVTVSL